MDFSPVMGYVATQHLPDYLMADWPGVFWREIGGFRNTSVRVGRDVIPKILRGLQAFYSNSAVRTAIFELLQDKLSPTVSKSNGRPGMTLWNILVCGVI